MNDPRWPDNAPGRFYISADCLLCGLCTDLAPGVFRVSEREDHAVVWRQPETERELAAAREAVEGCGVGAVCDGLLG
jgi:ferredoxin